MTGCLTCTSSKICTSCASGFTLSAGECDCLLANCLTCSTATTCITCIDGFYVNSTQKCSPCTVIPGCSNCNTSTFCTLCSGANFFNTSIAQCRPCSEAMPGCVDCDTQTVCLACTPQKYSTGPSCAQCSIPLTNCL